ncbi:MAG: GYD domain-containing protein [Chloroflexia bacterium]|nr:GYD domain-containing protein [Chloroflexia bacterium]
MAKYVILINWTDQGVRNATDTVTRFEQSRDAFQQMGVTIETVYWTLGRHDLVGILEAPDDQTLAAALLRLAGMGNVRTEALRAFTADEMGGILQHLG